MESQMKYNVLINDHGRMEHTTLKEDEWLTIPLDQMDVEAAIEEAGWCGTRGVLSNNPIVLWPFGVDIRPEALAFLHQGE
jgi:hypothetical protein